MMPGHSPTTKSIHEALEVFKKTAASNDYDLLYAEDVNGLKTETAGWGEIDFRRLSKKHNPDIEEYHFSLEAFQTILANQND